MSEIIMNGLTTILEMTGSIVFIIIGALIVYGLKLLCKKFGIELSDNEFETIINIVKQVIKYLDQKYVDSIKKDSPIGLTDDEKEDIKGKAISILKQVLTSDQISCILKKYDFDSEYVGGSIDLALEFLVESTIKEARAEDEVSEIIINESLDRQLEVLNEFISEKKRQ